MELIYPLLVEILRNVDETWQAGSGSKAIDPGEVDLPSVS